jgi:hypothetical protein
VKQAYAPPVRVDLLVLGLAATATAALIAIPATALASTDGEVFVLVPIAAAAIAGPLFGGIAASHTRRWTPLLAGCVITLISVVIILQFG